MQDYRTGEKAAGISSLFSCRIGRTPVWGRYEPPGLRDASRTRARVEVLVHPGVHERVQSAELAAPAGRQGGELLPRLNGFAPPLQHLRDIARREGTRSFLWWCLAMSWVTKV
jgi:hypothetical protein